MIVSVIAVVIVASCVASTFAVAVLMRLSPIVDDEFFEERGDCFGGNRHPESQPPNHNKISDSQRREGET